MNQLCLILCLLAGPDPAAEPWKTLQNCRLVAHDSNDGDSFHVQHAGKEFIFRLDYVDAPETDADFPDRVAEQARYFALTPRRATATSCPGITRL